MFVTRGLRGKAGWVCFTLAAAMGGTSACTSNDDRTTSTSTFRVFLADGTDSEEARDAITRLDGVASASLVDVDRFNEVLDDVSQVAAGDVIEVVIDREATDVLALRLAIDQVDAVRLVVGPIPMTLADELEFSDWLVERCRPEKTSVDVYFKVDGSQREIEEIVRDAKRDPELEHVDFLDDARTFAEAQSLFRERPEFLEGIEPGDLPQSLRFDAPIDHPFLARVEALEEATELVRAVKRRDECDAILDGHFGEVPGTR